jgi:regulator of protease activity HflC (stomatin/prohibitin superfamily)
MEQGLIVIAVIAVFVIAVLGASIKVVQEYERGVVFRLGRLVGARGPGLILLIPFIERMQKVDLRTVTMDIPAQEVITQDNVTIRVNAVAYFRVLDPNTAIVNVADYIRATSQIAQTTLRSVLGQGALDDLLSEREKINQQLARIIDEQTEPWGVKVSIVEVKDVELPQSMQRAMARQAEAEREKRAKIIHAQGEFQASQQLAAAADVINRNPVTIQLRYLQTLTEIGAEKNTTVVFPLPIDLINNVVNQVTGHTPSAPLPDVDIEDVPDIDIEDAVAPTEFDPATDDILTEDDDTLPPSRS